MKKTDTPRVKRTQRDYTLGFKLAVVEQVEKGSAALRHPRQKYRAHLFKKAW